MADENHLRSQKYGNSSSDIFAKERTLKAIFSFGILAASLFVCVGCGGPKPVSTETETKQLYESPEYEKQMMGEMSGEKK